MPLTMCIVQIAVIQIVYFPIKAFLYVIKPVSQLVCN